MYKRWHLIASRTRNFGGHRLVLAARNADALRNRLFRADCGLATAKTRPEGR